MNKNVYSLIFLLILCLLLFGCKKESNLKDSSNKNTANAVLEIKQTACDTADEQGTCFTKLPKLGIITPAECCSQMNRCCGGSKNDSQ